MSQVTITAKTGPGISVTAAVLLGVTSVVIDIKRGLLQVYQGSELTGPAKEFQLTDIATITDTITSGNHVIAIST